MKTSLLRSFLLMNLLACPKPVDPVSQAESTQAKPAQQKEGAPIGIEGLWYDDFQESYLFNADGTVENTAFEKATIETVAACNGAGFDVAACSEPRFLWRPHPKAADSFLFAIRIPLTSGATEERGPQCFCLPEPGLPMLAILNGDTLEVNTVGPDGNPIPTSGYTLKRTAHTP